MEKMPVATNHSICLTRKLNFTVKSSPKMGEVCVHMILINII